MPPTAANGTFSKISAASLLESKAVKRRKNTASNVIGTMIASLLTARCWFSKAPVHSIRYPVGRWMPDETFRCASLTREPRSRPRTESFTAIRLSLFSRYIRAKPGRASIVVSCESVNCSPFDPKSGIRRMDSKSETVPGISFTIRSKDRSPSRTPGSRAPARPVSTTPICPRSRARTSC